MRAAALILVASTAAAHAQPPGLTPPGLTPAEPWVAPPARRVAAYPHQTLLADAVTLGIVGLAVKNESEAFTVLGGISFVVATPVVHTSHKRNRRAAISLGLRAALPVAGALVGDSFDDNVMCDEYSCDALSRGHKWGLLMGALVAVAYDAFVLAERD